MPPVAVSVIKQVISPGPDQASLWERTLSFRLYTANELFGAIFAICYLPGSRNRQLWGAISG